MNYCPLEVSFSMAALNRSYIRGSSLNPQILGHTFTQPPISWIIMCITCVLPFIKHGWEIPLKWRSAGKTDPGPRGQKDLMRLTSIEFLAGEKHRKNHGIWGFHIL